MTTKLALLGFSCCCWLSWAFAAESPRVRVKGVADLGNGPVAALIESSGKRWKWCAVGDAFEGYRVTAIKPDSGVVSLAEQDGTKLEISLDKGTIKASATVRLLPVEELDWEWIRSDENPMRKAPESLPGWAMEQWASADENFKLAFANYYRQHGWELKNVSIGADRSRYSMYPLKNPADPVLTLEEKMKRAQKSRPLRQVKEGQVIH